MSLAEKVWDESHVEQMLVNPDGTSMDFGEGEFERMLKELKAKSKPKQPSAARLAAERRWNHLDARTVPAIALLGKRQHVRRPPLQGPVVLDRVVKLSDRVSLHATLRRGEGLVLRLPCAVNHLALQEMKAYVAVRRNLAMRSRKPAGVFSYVF